MAARPAVRQVGVEGAELEPDRAPRRRREQVRDPTVGEAPLRRGQERAAPDDDELGGRARSRLGRCRREPFRAAAAEDEGGVDGAGRVQELERGRSLGQATSTGVGARRAQSMTSARIRSRSMLGRQPIAAWIFSIDGRRWSMSSIPWP